MYNSSWEWAQSCSKHIEDSNKHIIEETVCQVGHQPELYEDTRSEKRTNKKGIVFIALYEVNILI